MTRSGETGLLGIRVGVADLQTLVDASMASIEARQVPFTFACANPHSLVVAQSDAEFRTALDGCSAVVADGVGLTMASRLVGANVGPRITGTDYFLGVMSQLDRRGGRVFFLGSTDHVLKRIVAKAGRQSCRRPTTSGHDVQLRTGIHGEDQPRTVGRPARRGLAGI